MLLLKQSSYRSRRLINGWKKFVPSFLSLPAWHATEIRRIPAAVALDDQPRLMNSITFCASFSFLDCLAPAKLCRMLDLNREYPYIPFVISGR